MEGMLEVLMNMMSGDNQSNEHSIKYKYDTSLMIKMIMEEFEKTKSIDNNPLYKFWKEQSEFHKTQDIDESQFNSTYREDLKSSEEGIREDILSGNVFGDINRNMRGQISWYIPSPSNLEWLTQFSPIVEMGAGHGYLARLLQNLGCEIISFDHNIQQPSFTRVLQGTPKKLIDYKDSTLLLCWPPQMSHIGKEMSLDCLKIYPGKNLIYIGEGKGGCCATDEFFTELEQNWELIETKSCPRMPNIYDSVLHYRKKIAL